MRSIKYPASVISELEKLVPLLGELLRIGQQVTSLARALATRTGTDGSQRVMSLLRDTLEQAATTLTSTAKDADSPRTSASGEVEIDLCITAMQLAQSSGSQFSRGSLNPLLFARALNSAGESMVYSPDLLHRKMVYVNKYKDHKPDLPDMERMEIKLMVKEARLRKKHEDLQKQLSQQSGASIYIDPRQDSVMRRHVNTGKINREEMEHIRRMNLKASEQMIMETAPTQQLSPPMTPEQERANLPVAVMCAAKAGDPTKLRVLLRPLTRERRARLLNTTTSPREDPSTKTYVDGW